MVRIAVLGLSLIVIGVDAGWAQDIAGIEDCTKTSGLDKRTGCLQSNVNFLQRLVTKNALDARQKLDAAAAEIIALKGVVTSLQKTVEQLQAAQKAAGDKSRRPSNRAISLGVPRASPPSLRLIEEAAIPADIWTGEEGGGTMSSVLWVPPSPEVQRGLRVKSPEPCVGRGPGEHPVT
jgi:outer membrane murein-binding lipoprotein Lpp